MIISREEAGKQDGIGKIDGDNLLLVLSSDVILSLQNTESNEKKYEQRECKIKEGYRQNL